MSQPVSSTVPLKVPPEIARIVQPRAPRDVQLEAARGALPLADRDLLTVLFFLCRSQDLEIKKAAVISLRQFSKSDLFVLLEEDSLHPQLLELLARARTADAELMGAVISHPATALKTHLYLAEKAGADVLARLADHRGLLQENPQLIEAIIANPAVEDELKTRLGWQNPEQPIKADQAEVASPPADVAGADEDGDDGHSTTELESLMEEAEVEGLSKYQLALELKVSEKIKMGMTGDKEWRALMIKEANKLIQGAVMKNPRITDGEVLMVAKNKTTSDDLIRIILLNKDWIKRYEIKKAMVVHPKTPPPKALRFVSYLTTKDIKDLAKSRQVSTIVSTAARKELEKRLKKTGG